MSKGKKKTIDRTRADVTPDDHLLNLAQHQSIAQTSKDVVGEVNPKRSEIYWFQDIGHTLLGYNPGELEVGLQNIHEIVYAEDEQDFLHPWAGFLKNSTLRHECRLATKQGRPVWVHLLGFNDKLASGNSSSTLLLVVRDVDEIRRNSKISEEAKHMSVMETMAAGIAHEFNNDLTPVRGFIELSLDHLGENHPVTSGLQTALNRVEHTAELVEQIQSYGRKALLNPRPADINRMLPSITRVALSLAENVNRRINIVEQLGENVPMAAVDHSRFRRAIIQLVGNAVTAMPHGGTLTLITQFITLNEGKKKTGDFVSICIQDTGEGIQEKNIHRIFDPFFTTRGRVMARGMGLSMAQGIVAQHGGWMSVDSKVGKGTSVYIYLPALPIPKEEIAKEGETLKVLPAAPAGRLLIADDEDYIRQLIVKIFRPEGWVIDEAHDHQEVLMLVESNPRLYDLILLDLTMPGPFPEATLRTMKKYGCEAKIVIISGAAFNTRIEDMLVEGEIEFISKPFSPKALVALVDRIMVT